MTTDINTKKETLKKVTDLKKKLQDFRFEMSGSKVRNTKEARNTKKEIARLMTTIA